MHLADCGRSRFRSPTSPVFCIFAVDAHSLEHYNIDARLITMRTSDGKGWLVRSHFAIRVCLREKLTPTSTAPCSVRHRLQNARGDSHRKKTIVCYSLFGFHVREWRFSRCFLWPQLKMLICCADLFFSFFFFYFADDGCADGCCTPRNCTCDRRANDWRDHDFFTSCCHDRKKVGMFIDL